MHLPPTQLSSSPPPLSSFSFTHTHAYMYIQKHVNIPTKIVSVGTGFQRVGTKVDTGEQWRGPGVSRSTSHHTGHSYISQPIPLPFLKLRSIDQLGETERRSGFPKVPQPIHGESRIRRMSWKMIAEAQEYVCDRVQKLKVTGFLASNPGKQAERIIGGQIIELLSLCRPCEICEFSA